MDNDTKAGKPSCRHERINAYLQHDIRNTTPAMQREFAYFSANLANLLPHVPRHSYLPIFNALQANRMLSDLDMEQPDAIRVQGWDAARAQAIRERPGIICTFHTGSYRFLNLLLAQAAIPCSLVVSGSAIDSEQRAYQSRFVPAARRLGIQPDVEFIHAEHPGSLIRMARAAKEGRCLLVYPDGNTGAGRGNRDVRNLLVVPFGAGRMRVRKGIAVLAYRLGLPIYTVACRRRFPDMAAGNSHHLVFRHEAALCPAGGENEGDFAARAMAALYRSLQAVATACPQEWEGWLNVHETVVRDAATIADGAFVPEEYTPIRQGNQLCLLHHPTYALYRVSEGSYERLREFYDSLLALN